MSTKARQSPHTVTCHGCRKPVPAAEPLYIEVRSQGHPPICPEEQGRRKAYEESLTDSQRASLNKLRAVFSAMGSRQGWHYAVLCHACKQQDFKLSRPANGIPFPNNRGSEDMGAGNSFGEHVELAYHHAHCRGCGRPIYWSKGYKMPREHCGDGCRTLYRRKLRLAQAPEREHSLTCAQCGELFQARRNDAKYCSPRCRQRAKRARAVPEVRADGEKL